MNAVLNRKAIQKDAQRKDAQPEKATRQFRYDSRLQEVVAQLVLDKHKVTLRKLAK
jgi:hypothetical protein